MMKGCDLAITNVPGPPIALYAAGAEVEAIVPFAPKGGAAANFGLMTYNGIAYVGINIDTRAIPDPDAFVEHIARRLRQGAGPGRPGCGSARWACTPEAAHGHRGCRPRHPARGL